MKYDKPKVTYLGDAAQEIQSVGKVPLMPPENQPQSSRMTLPAYEADE